MAEPRARHLFPKVPRTCSVCGRAFLAKSSLAETCYEEACQVTARRRREAARYQRHAAGAR